MVSIIFLTHQNGYVEEYFLGFELIKDRKVGEDIHKDSAKELKAYAPKTGDAAESCESSQSRGLFNWPKLLNTLRLLLLFLQIKCCKVWASNCKET